MHTFEDEQGQAWQVAVLDASFGSVMLVFSRHGSTDLLKGDLYAADVAEAREMLAAMDDAELRSRLAEAVPVDGV